MTKRAVIISTSVIVGLVMVFTILFGVVFRVRKIDVVCGEDFYYKTQVSEIVKDSKLRKNTSTFAINRNKITKNIESAYPYARVKGVNIKGASSVKIVLSNRVPLYYFVQEAVYYILDEDGKILDITNNATLANNLIKLENNFSASDSTVAGQFVDTKYSKICKDLYVALYTNATIEVEQNGEYVQQYLEREDMCEIIDNIKFSEEYIITGKTDKLNITTSYGVKITIIEPQKDLNYKINMAFSALRALMEEDRTNGSTLTQSGSINVIYTYDDNYHPIPVAEYRSKK